MAHLTKLERVWRCFRAAISAKYRNRGSSRTVIVSDRANLPSRLNGRRLFAKAFWIGDFGALVRPGIGLPCSMFMRGFCGKNKSCNFRCTGVHVYVE